MENKAAVEVTTNPVAPVKLREVIEQRSPWVDALRRFRRNRLAMAGVLVVVILLLIAITADLITPFPYDRVFLNLRASTLPGVDSLHPLGLDTSSRDYLARLIYGARTSMTVGLLVPIIAFSIGVPLGAISGYFGGKVDFGIQRVIDVATAVPPLLFTLFLLSILGNGLPNVILVLGITGWIESTRLTRAQFLTYREKEFVAAARALGASNRDIIMRHILPNAISPLLINFSIAIPSAIFAEAGLSFLGIGISEPTASWGKMVGGGIGNNIKVFWHLALFPTLLVAITMLSFSFVGDGLQEALDPNRSQ